MQLIIGHRAQPHGDVKQEVQEHIDHTHFTALSFQYI